MEEVTIVSLKAENDRLKYIIDSYKRALEVNHVSCLNFSLEVHAERIKVSAGNNEGLIDWVNTERMQSSASLIMCGINAVML